MRTYLSKYCHDERIFQSYSRSLMGDRGGCRVGPSAAARDAATFSSPISDQQFLRRLNAICGFSLHEQIFLRPQGDLFSTPLYEHNFSRPLSASFSRYFYDHLHITGFFLAENFSRPFLLFHTHFIPCKCFSGQLYYTFLNFSRPFHFVRVGDRWLGRITPFGYVNATLQSKPKQTLKRLDTFGVCKIPLTTYIVNI
jgi:hypothetical protein